VARRLPLWLADPLIIFIVAPRIQHRPHLDSGCEAKVTQLSRHVRCGAGDPVECLERSPEQFLRLVRPYGGCAEVHGQALEILPRHHASPGAVRGLNRHLGAAKRVLRTSLLQGLGGRLHTSAVPIGHPGWIVDRYRTNTLDRPSPPLSTSARVAMTRPDTTLNGNVIGMRASIDRLGRIVIPKALRDELGLTPGTVLEMAVEGGSLVGRVPSRVREERDEHGPRFVLDDPGEALTAERVRTLLEEGRR
jgi:AbrB family looped-hinge helix DNA binding protein